MNSKYQIVTLIFTMCLVEGLQAQFSPCQKCSSGPLPLACSIEGCTSLPCRIVKGRPVNGSCTVDIPNDTTVIPVTAVIRLAGFVFAIIHQEACQYLTNGQTCPVIGGSVITFQITYQTDPFWPNASVIATITARDDKNNVVACAVIPFDIVSA